MTAGHCRMIISILHLEEEKSCQFFIRFHSMEIILIDKMVGLNKDDNKQLPFVMILDVDFLLVVPIIAEKVQFLT